MKKNKSNLETEIQMLRQELAKSRANETALREKFKGGVAGIAHDLKTPLAIILGYVECIQDGIDDKDYLSLIAEKAESMNDVVQSIVETAKAENEQIECEQVEINAREYFKRAFLKFKNLADTKNIKFKVGKVPDINLYADIKQIERVIQNLITNAVKFTQSKGKIKIKFKLKGYMLHISVKDTGCGIAKENLENVFDKFFKEDEARPLNASSGLGLNIVKGFVKSHGGEVFVKSKKGKGSKFSFSLPVLRVDFGKMYFVDRFEMLPVWHKILWLTFLFPFFPCFYRIMQYGKTKQKENIWAALMAIPFSAFFWIVDFMSQISHSRLVVFVK